MMGFTNYMMTFKERDQEGIEKEARYTLAPILDSHHEKGVDQTADLVDPLLIEAAACIN